MRRVYLGLRKSSDHHIDSQVRFKSIRQKISFYFRASPIRETNLKQGWCCTCWESFLAFFCFLYYWCLVFSLLCSSYTRVFVNNTMQQISKRRMRNTYEIAMEQKQVISNYQSTKKNELQYMSVLEKLFLTSMKIIWYP